MAYWKSCVIKFWTVQFRSRAEVSPATLSLFPKRYPSGFGVG